MRSSRCWTPLTAGTASHGALATATAVSSLSSTYPPIPPGPSLIGPSCGVLGKCNCTNIDLRLFEIRRSRHWAHALMGIVFFPSHSLSFSIPVSLPHLSQNQSRCETTVPQPLIVASTRPPKGSEHVYTGSCAPLLKSTLCGISGDWHVLCPSERVSSAQKCDSWAELAPPTRERRTEVRRRETRNERTDVVSRGCRSFPGCVSGAKQMLAHVL